MSSPSRLCPNCYMEDKPLIRSVFPASHVSRPECPLWDASAPAFAEIGAHVLCASDDGDLARRIERRDAPSAVHSVFLFEIPPLVGTRAARAVQSG